MSEIEKAIAFFKSAAINGVSLTNPYMKQALESLQEKQEREKGCEYCNEEKSFEIYHNGENAGKAWLHKCSDGYALFLEINGQEIMYIDAYICPNCGRDLRKPAPHD